MRLALHTNRYTDMARGDAAMRRAVELAEKTILPFIVLAELRVGFLGGTQSRENERALRRFCTKPSVKVLMPDEATTHHYSAVHRQLRGQGTPIPVNDMWIAALCIQHGLTLYARDAHFGHLPQLMRV